MIWAIAQNWASHELDDLVIVQSWMKKACELEELPTSKSEIIGRFIPDLKLADDEIGQNNVADEVVKKSRAEKLNWLKNVANWSLQMIAMK